MSSSQPNVLAADTSARYPARFWVAVVLAGLAGGLAGGLLLRLLQLVQRIVWHRPGGFSAAAAATPGWQRLLILCGTGLLVAACLPLLARLPSTKPNELEATIWYRDGRLPIAKTLARSLLSIVLVGLGASLGREAAPKQVGALAGHRLAQMLALPPTQRRLLAACGAGAGIAAIYNVPFGAALFALEVLLGSLALPLVAPAFLATMVGTAASYAVIPDAPTFHLPAMPISAGLVAFALAFGPLAGLAAAAWVRLVGLAAALKFNGWRASLAAVVVFSALGLAAKALPQVLGNGEGVVELAWLGLVATPALVALLLAKPIATAACLGTGAPGGLFLPTITIGAVLGAAAGAAWLHLWPGAPPGAFALVGAGAVLAAATKGPVSALVLVLELTRHIDGLLLPLLLAIAGATALCRRLEPRSIYTSRLTMPGLEAEASTATPLSDLARQLMARAAAGEAGNAAIVVIDGTGEPAGILGRREILDAFAPAPDRDRHRRRRPRARGRGNGEAVTGGRGALTTGVCRPVVNVRFTIFPIAKQAFSFRPIAVTKVAHPAQD